jgi:hypothetical protein
LFNHYRKVSRREARGKEKKTITRMMYAASLGLFLVWICVGCSKGAPEHSVVVPVDCQQFLDKYFEAVKSKDVEKIKEFSSYVPIAQRKDMSEGSLDMMRESKGKFATDGFEHVTKEFGDFQSYSVVSVKVTTIAESDPAAKMLPAGIHAEITCKAKFSNKQSA